MFRLKFCFLQICVLSPRSNCCRKEGMNVSSFIFPFQNSVLIYGSSLLIIKLFKNKTTIPIFPVVNN
ncbi:unnamed protein product [Allacma fusca]|uniref:Uncharacterized protein n=1 Tax=Allacma fusca TaxID=39272 RepID=A0A8J2LN97_9HEXA|nr:unnamed protein product [Allacma fusca]